ncbi:hypothetical protein ACFXHA_16775 [Nocardia sp. NPDC059240]|uniref:hypothetical protein n=1 Tax=Nocardia sp. NPDC059240 TaxID=3346786 RepID=UPI0036C262C4
MIRRVSAALALTGLACAALAGCSSDSKDKAAPSSAANAPASVAAAPATDFCSGMRDLAKSTREIASKSTITPAEYSKTADQFDALKASAPADAVADIETMSAKYRAIAAGTTTVTAEGPTLAKATLHLQEVQVANCPVPTK